MEGSTSNDVALLNDIMEGITHEDGESLIQQAVCALVGVAEGSIDNVAEALGLRQSNSLIQIGVYIVTMAAIQPYSHTAILFNTILS